MTGGPVTALGFPKAGSAVNYLIHYGNRYLWQQYKPGTYVIKGTGTGAKVTATGSACSGGSVTTVNGVPFRITTHVSAMVAPTGDAAIRPARPASFGVSVSAAGVSDMTDLVVCHMDDEAHQAAGDAASFFTLEALADYTTQSKGPLRMMQWQQMTRTYMQDEADIPADKMIAIANAWGTVPRGDSRRDGARAAKSVRAMPSPEMMARLCVATGMPMWRAMPSSSPISRGRIVPANANAASSPGCAAARQSAASCACARSACEATGSSARAREAVERSDQ